MTYSPRNLAATFGGLGLKAKVAVGVLALGAVVGDVALIQANAGLWLVMTLAVAGTFALFTGAYVLVKRAAVQAAGDHRAATGTFDDSDADDSDL